MNISEFNQQARAMSDQIERINEINEWLKKDTEREFNKPVQQVATPKPVTPVTPPQNKLQQLTPARIKREFDLRGESFLNETIAELGRQFPDQPHANKTKTLPPPPLPRSHEQILEMVKRGDSIENILARFEA